jgi:NADH:ubiquinone oxidoreductase subunit 2 (subunit N)
MILFGCVVAANGGDDNDIMFGVPSLLVRIKFSVFFAKEKNGWLMMLLLFCVGVSLDYYLRLIYLKRTLFDLAGTKNGRKVLARSRCSPTNTTVKKRYMCYVSSSFPTRNKMSN